MNIISLGLSIFAVCLSLTIAVIEWHRYHLPLVMVLDEVNFKDSMNNDRLLFLWIAFVNPSSVGKTVFNIKSGTKDNVDVTTCPYSIDQENSHVLCQLPDSSKYCRIDSQELLWLPLDIPPHQSVIKAFPLLITLPSTQSQKKTICLTLEVYDVLSKKMASIQQEVRFENYQIR